MISWLIDTFNTIRSANTAKSIRYSCGWLLKFLGCSVKSFGIILSPDIRPMIILYRAIQSGKPFSRCDFVQIDNMHQCTTDDTCIEQFFSAMARKLKIKSLSNLQKLVPALKAAAKILFPTS